MSGLDVTGRYVVVDGTRTYYDQCGDQGPLVICIHPAGTSSMQFYDFIQLLAARGFTAIAIDLPGHGKSYPVDWEPTRRTQDYARFLRRFIELVAPRGRAIILGGAIGGGIALELAIDHPEAIEAALAFSVTAAPEGEQFSAYCEWWEHPHSMPGWRDLSERVAMSGTYGLTGTRLEEFRWQHRYCAQEVSTSDLECWANFDVRTRLGEVSCPVLLLKGEADYWVPEEAVDRLVAAVPAGLAEKVIGRGMGHYPMFETPATLVEVVVDFLVRRGLATVGVA